MALWRSLAKIAPEIKTTELLFESRNTEHNEVKGHDEQSQDSACKDQIDQNLEVILRFYECEKSGSKVCIICVWNYEAVDHEDEVIEDFDHVLFYWRERLNVDYIKKSSNLSANK